MRFSNQIRHILAGCTALGAAGLGAIPVLAQEADDTGGLQEIIVTAQKREQSLQDVPIAVTALGGEALQANRVTNVVDLSGLAPGVTVRVSAGGSGLPIFAVRGQLSYGIAPGSDKQTSIYLDGVYIASPRGSIFDLPDVERIEILRGPQGTLFGRNATSGAVSVSTREPDGEAAVKATLTMGNQDHWRWRISASTPQIGPFSGYFSHVHEQRRGDIKNLGAPITWNRLGSVLPRVARNEKSVNYLGSRDVDSWFAALKFESGDFKTVYRYDRSDSSGSPEATSLLALRPAGAGPLGPFLSALISSNGVQFADNQGKRPKGVWNSWVTPVDQQNEGHSLTSTYAASDKLTIKAILGKRKTFLWATSPIDGFSALPITQAASNALGGAFNQIIGQPWVGIVSGAVGAASQKSAELQVNYDSDFVTATVGAMWFKSKDRVAHHRQRNTTSFSAIPGGVLQNTGIGDYFNKAKSVAAFAQGEFHVTPQLDVILGARVTNDKKFSSLTYGNNPAALSLFAADYDDNKFNYLVGLNYKMSDDILLYAKYSTAYVSGGSTAGVDFQPETTKSAEAGIKAEWLDRKLRTNMTVWWADVKHLQSPSSPNTVPAVFDELAGNNPAKSFISLFVLDVGSRKSWGVEFDAMAAPMRGLTLGGNISYTHLKVYDVNVALQTAYKGNYTGRSNVPELTGSVYVQYDTEPFMGDAYLSLRTDAIFQDSVETDSNPGAAIFAVAPDLLVTESYWTVNGRVALRDLSLGGVKAELALWGRNLFDKETFGYALNLSDIFYAGNYIPARSYGVDLTLSF
jgi:iron complex outermembrane receptor protein